MTDQEPVRSTLAVGYDVVLPVDPSIYEIEEDAAGRAYAFDFREAREGLAAAARRAVDRPEFVGDLEIEPGYVRAKVEPPADAAHPGELLEALRSVPDEYNERHAKGRDLDGFAFGREYYLASYRPEDAPTRGEALGDLEIDAAPDADGPLYEYTRADAGADVLGDGRWFAYRVVLPFDPEMYDEDARLGGVESFAFDWEHPEVREALTVAVETLPAWPGGAENLPRVEIHPGYAVIDFYSRALADPASVATGIRDALTGYNRYRPDEDRQGAGRHTRHPPLAFAGTGYVAALEHGGDADAWIRARGLDVVDGAPAYPEPDVPTDEDAAAGGRFDALNPFSG